MGAPPQQQSQPAATPQQQAPLLKVRKSSLGLLMAAGMDHVITAPERYNEETDVLSNVIDVHISRLRSKIDKGFAVRKIERRVGVHLSPDEHVFGSERDLLVTVSHVRAYRFHDLIFWKIDLRI